MRYRGSLTIPAGTLEKAPTTQVVSLCYGMITEVEILFPAGHAGLTYLQVWRHERQILPTSDGEAFRGDDHLIDMTESYAIFEVPHEVELRGWAPDATLDHTIYVDITVLPPAATASAGPVFVPLPEGF